MQISFSLSEEEANEPLTEADIEALNAMASRLLTCTHLKYGKLIQSSKVRISDDGYSLIFVDTGKVVGHRALREYYKQNIRPIEQNEAVIALVASAWRYNFI